MPNSRIQEGAHPLVVSEYVDDDGRHNGFRVDVPGAGSWEAASVVPDGDLEWTCEPDDGSDDLEVALTLEAYALLVVRARTHCPSCDGCARTGA